MNIRNLIKKEVFAFMDNEKKSNEFRKKMSSIEPKLKKIQEKSAKQLKWQKQEFKRRQKITESLRKRETAMILEKETNPNELQKLNKLISDAVVASYGSIFGKKHGNEAANLDYNSKLWLKKIKQLKRQPEISENDMKDVDYAYSFFKDWAKKVNKEIESDEKDAKFFDKKVREASSYLSKHGV